VVGKTATLELSSRSSEMLALAHQLGTLSLALRSLVDSGTQQADARPQRADSIVVYRGADAEAYSCTPNCDHRITLGGSATDPSPPPARSGSEGSPAPVRPAPK
jgi:hypothetical protein